MSTLNHAEFVKKLEDNAREILDYAGNEAPRILGNTAKNFFAENFQKEGFVNGGLHKWQDVKRRLNPPKKTKRPADAQRKILTGTGALGRSIERKAGKKQVSILSELPYAKAQNEGADNAGRRRNVRIPKRQFMGDSAELDKLIRKEINRKLKSL